VGATRVQRGVYSPLGRTDRAANGTEIRGYSSRNPRFRSSRRVIGRRCTPAGRARLDEAKRETVIAAKTFAEAVGQVSFTLGLALVIIFLILVAILAFIATSWRQDRAAAWLFVPYATWVPSPWCGMVR
jgi:hypothetical protein